MKTIIEIFNMLVNELSLHIDKIESKTRTSLYFNEILGDTSFLLAGLLGSLLKYKFDNWDDRKWFDDCLISKVLLQNDKLKLYGVMIWGKNNSTEQWTEPFIFNLEISNKKVKSQEFTFLFGDLDKSEINYEDFRNDRDYWKDKDRNWKYILNSKDIISKSR